MQRLRRNLITTDIHFPKLWSSGHSSKSILPAPEGYCRVETGSIVAAHCNSATHCRYESTILVSHGYVMTFSDNTIQAKIGFN